MNLRRLTRITACLFVILAAVAASRAADSAAFTPVLLKGQLVHPTRLLAKVKTGAQASAHASVLAAHGLRATRGYALVPGLVVLEVDPHAAAMAAATSGAPVADAQAAQLQARLTALRASGLFEYVEPDHLVFPDATPADSAFTNGTLWALRNTGQSGGALGVDIDAVRAWDITTGSTSVIVAVIDSGIRYTHVDLAAQMWHNPGEIPGNGVDDDNNGFVDDVHGINAINDTGNPMDDDGHGTHVAGTIGAAANNGQAHVGVAWNVRLMACKFFDAGDGGTFSDLLQCYDYAVAHGAKILNCSFGSRSDARSERDAIAAARDQGVLVVAAAGNDGVNNDSVPHYPSSYDLENVVAVAAFDRFGLRAGFSNFGVRSVDLGAPGVEIYSTVQSSDTAYATFQGTSMAAPHVAGVAALVRAQFPGISVADLRDRLVGTTTAMFSLQGITVSGGRVNAYQALTADGDGQLKLAITPAAGTAFVHGHAVPVVVRVRDLVGVAGATVTGTISGGSTLPFFDNGVAPDAVANDSRYTGTLTLPATGTELALTVNASAPGRTDGSASVTYALRPPPPNDHFADRVTLAFNNGSVTADNFGGTLEPGEPLIAGEGGGASLWWTWTASGSTSVTIDTIGSPFDTLLGVFTGASVDALTEIASNDDIDGPEQPSKVTFAATAGTVYQIVVDGWEGKTGAITLNLDAHLPPANDNFAQRSEVSGTTFNVTGTNRYATREVDEPALRNASGANSVWWTWTAPTTGTAVFSSAASGFTSDVSLYTGTTLAQLIRVPGRAVEDLNNGYSRRTIAAIAGTTYQICVSSLTADMVGDVRLSLGLTPGPVNDHFSQRALITGASATVTGSNVSATREPGEPMDPAYGSGATVWWTWTAPFGGRLEVNSNGTNFATLISLYTGSTLEGLTPVATSVAGLPQLAVAAGTTLQIAVDGSTTYGGEGAIQLNLTLVQSTGNDLFTDRIEVAGTAITFSGSNVGATHEPGEPAHHVHAGGRSVWWSWTAPATGTTTIDVAGSNPVVAIYTGSEVATLSRVPPSTLGLWGLSHARFHAEGGTTYQIAVDGRFWAESEVTLSLLLSPAPPNDMFADRVALPGTGGTVNGSNDFASGEYGESVHGFYLLSSVWWSWTAPANVSVSVDVVPQGFEATVGVYTGGVVWGNTLVADSANSGPQEPSARFAAVAGTTYEIVVDSRSMATGAFALTLSTATAPANDRFASAAALAGRSAAATDTNLGATREIGEPTLYGPSYGGRSVWWNWTAPESGFATFSTAGSTFDTMMGVFTGTNVAALTMVASDAGDPAGGTTSRAVAAVTAGTVYRIVVDGYYGAAGTIVLQVAMADPPGNDNFAHAIEITGTAVAVPGTTLAATSEPGEPGHDGSAAASSVWWKWTAPSTGTVALEIASGMSSPRFGVYSGGALNTLTALYDGGRDEWSRFHFHAVAGTVYFIAIDSTYGLGGDLDLALSLLPAPGNDMFVDRLALTGAAVAAVGTLDNGTRESGEPSPGPTSYSTIWWSWTAPATGRAYISTEGDFLHVMSVYTGTSLPNLSLLGTRSNGSNFMLIDVVAGGSYTIAVGDYYGSLAGTVELKIALTTPPANDTFASRASLSGAPVSVTGSNLGAAIEPTEPWHQQNYSNSAASVWWTWTAPVSGRVEISVGRSAIDAVVAVYTGVALGVMDRVVSLGGTVYGTTRVIFDVIAGTTYQIAVDGYQGGMGPIVLDLAIHDPPANDRFADRHAINGASLAVTGASDWAAAESNEPYQAYANVWWTWTAPTSGLVILDTAGSDFRTQLAVFTGTAFGALTPVNFNSFFENPDLTARRSFFATAGTTYQIAVDGQNGATGAIALHLNLHDPPANDRFASRATLAGAAPVVTGTNRGASREDYEYNHAGEYTAHSVWWTWTAPAAGDVIVSTAGSDFDTVLAVYTGSDLGALSQVAFNQDLAPGVLTSRVVFAATAGTVYPIVVDGHAGALGTIALRVEPVVVPQATIDVSAASVSAGSAVTLTARASGNGPFAFQWLLDGVEIAGATASALHLASAQQFAAGIYSVLVRDALGSSTSPSTTLTITEPPPSGARLTNLSTRAVALTGDNVLIPGFVVEGPGNKQLLIRAVGPTLGTLGVTGTLPDPRLVLKRWNPALPPNGGYEDVTANDDWGTNPNAVDIIAKSVELSAFPLAAGSADAALLVDLAPGQYSVVASDAGPATGIAIVELYDADDSGGTSRLINISNRGYVGVGDNIMIPGFVVSNEGPKTLLIRVVGPTLGAAPYNVPGVLADPTLSIYRHDFVNNADELILTNDDWSVGPGATRTRDVAVQVLAFPLPEGSKDAAFVVTLNPGVYTVHARGKDDTEGVALVEVYAVP